MSEYLNSLSDQFTSLPNWAKVAIGAVVVGVPTYILLKCNKTRKSPYKTDFKTGVVYVFQFPRSPVIPSLSPFALKLETFLRMNDIHYEVLLKIFRFAFLLAIYVHFFFRMSNLTRLLFDQKKECYLSSNWTASNMLIAV